MEKGENPGYQHFFCFPCFQKPFQGRRNHRLFDKGLNCLYMLNQMCLPPLVLQQGWFEMPINLTSLRDTFTKQQNFGRVQIQSICR